MDTVIEKQKTGTDLWTQRIRIYKENINKNPIGNKIAPITSVEILSALSINGDLPPIL